MKNKKGLFLVLLSMVFILSACTKKEELVMEEKEKYTPVLVEKAVRKDISNNRILNGRVVSDDSMGISPKIAGRVESVKVSLGDNVKEGDVLFTIEQTDLNRNVQQSDVSIELARKGLDQAKNAIEMSKTNLETAKANLDKAKIDLDRGRELFEEGGMAKSQLEQLELAYVSAESQFKNAESQLVQSQISLSQAESQVSQAELGKNQVMDTIDNTIVRSPISGVVSSLDVKVGQIIGSGQVALTVVNNNRSYIKFEVIEDLVNDLSIGEELSLSIPSLGQDRIAGKISYISPVADVGNKLYSVNLNLLEPISGLKPGMTAEIELLLNKKEAVLVVDRNAVLNSEGLDFVYVVKDNKALRKELSLGLDTGQDVEVLEGLSEGEEVIVKGQHYVNDGSVVKIVGGEEDESI